MSEPPMDPKKPGVPISYPLKTLKELEDRSYFDSFHFPFNKSSVPLPPYRASKPLENRPRILVCHDMKGGYVDDKWVQGNKNSEAYAIWHWYLIDIFVYFSHNLVTLPPPCWINTGHRHGVQTNLALVVAKEAAVSVAIFAPGWVYETNQGPNFEDANNRWWVLVGQSWTSAQSYPDLLPFFSSFDQGRGKGIYIEGQQVSDQSWSNISCQSYQPLLEVAPDSLKDKLQAFTNFDFAYDGGACITIKGDMEEGTHFMTKLFHGSLRLGNSPLHVSYSVKSIEDSRLCLALQLSNSLDAEILIFIAPEGTFKINTSNFVLQLPDKSYETAGSKFTKFNVQGSASLLQESNDWHLQEYTLQLDGYKLNTVYAVCYKKNLDCDKVLQIFNESKFLPSSSTGAYEHLEKQNAKSVGFESSLPSESSEKLSYHASLGHITLTSSDDEQNVPPSDSWDFKGDDISWDTASTGQKMLNTNLVWRLKMGPNFSNAEVGPTILRYDLYVEKIQQLQAHNLRGKGPVTNTVEHLGVAVVQAFYVSQLIVPPDCRTLRFFLQVCSPSGDFQALKDSPSLSIDVPSLV